MQSQLNCGTLNCSNCKKCGGPSNINKACIEALRATCEPKSKPEFQFVKGGDSDTDSTKIATTKDEQNLTILGTVLLDIIGAIAFFVMVTTIFWISASLYVKRLLVELYNAPRNTQLIVGTILAILFLSFTIHATIATRQRRTRVLLHTQVAENTKTKTHGTQTETITPKATPPQIVEKNRTRFFRCGHRKTMDSRLKGGGCKNNCPPGNRKSYPFCPKYDTRKCKKPAASNICFTLADKATNTPMSDEEGLEIFRNYRTYSYAMDMKSPPALLIYLRNYFVNRFCNENQNQDQ